MTRTFEELAGGELDALYQGALFLAAGRRGVAEELLVDAVSVAFRDHAWENAIEDMERWLEGRLVRSFVRRAAVGPPPAPVRGRSRPTTMVANTMTAQGLFHAARIVPARPRAAIWLVLLRRWSYRDAAEALGVTRQQLRELLRYRDAWMSEVMRSAQGGRGMNAEISRA